MSFHLPDKNLCLSNIHNTIVSTAKRLEVGHLVQNRHFAKKIDLSEKEEIFFNISFRQLFWKQNVLLSKVNIYFWVQIILFTFAQTKKGEI